MPKKMGVNSKAEAARTRKSAVEAERKEKDARDKEERYWKEAEGSKSRAAKKREDEAEKRAELVARKAEIRRLAEMEQQEIEKAMRKPDKKASRVSIPVPKVTEADLERRREEERLRLQRESEAAKKRQSRTTAEEEYERMVLVSNTNRDDSLIEAHTVEEAIAQMSVAEPGLPPDRHPERRLKASFKAFEEAELPKLKEEKPGLTLTQYKDMIWKLWQRSPDNPMNAQLLVLALLALYEGISNFSRRMRLDGDVAIAFTPTSTQISAKSRSHFFLETRVFYYLWPVTSRPRFVGLILGDSEEEGSGEVFHVIYPRNAKVSVLIRKQWCAHAHQYRVEEGTPQMTHSR